VHPKLLQGVGEGDVPGRSLAGLLERLLRSRNANRTAPTATIPNAAKITANERIVGSVVVVVLLVWVEVGRLLT